MDKDSLIVDGFVFPSYQETQTALKEQKNIEIIRERTLFSDSVTVYELYIKLIERDMFKTVIGYSFLYELRYRLVTEYQYDKAELPAVSLPKRMEYDTVNEINQNILETKFQRILLIKKRMSIMIGALVFMVLGMFVIAAINPDSGYVNTENKILNKYSAWEENLEEREKAVRKKEEQLKMNSME